MRKHRKVMVSIAIAAAAISYRLVPKASAAGPTAGRTIELIADKDNRWRFPDGQKGPVTLKSGEVVKFKITSYFGGEKAKDGALHSFVVRKLRDNDPSWSVRLKDGVQEFTVTAPKPGNYLIECTVECGKGHDDMNIKMVVTK